MMMPILKCTIATRFFTRAGLDAPTTTPRRASTPRRRRYDAAITIRLLRRFGRRQYRFCAGDFCKQAAICAGHSESSYPRRAPLGCTQYSASRRYFSIFMRQRAAGDDIEYYKRRLSLVPFHSPRHRECRKQRLVGSADAADISPLLMRSSHKAACLRHKMK